MGYFEVTCHLPAESRLMALKGVLGPHTLGGWSFDFNRDCPHPCDSWGTGVDCLFTGLWFLFLFVLATLGAFIIIPSVFSYAGLLPLKRGFSFAIILRLFHSFSPSIYFPIIFTLSAFFHHFHDI